MKLKKMLFLGVVIFMLSSCASSELYYWGKYDEAVYDHHFKQTDKSEQELIKVYKDIIKNQNKGTRKKVPPGIYADYGMILIKNGDVEKGRAFLESEMKLYPESSAMILYILSKL